MHGVFFVNLLYIFSTENRILVVYCRARDCPPDRIGSDHDRVFSSPPPHRPHSFDRLPGIVTFTRRGPYNVSRHDMCTHKFRSFSLVGGVHAFSSRASPTARSVGGGFLVHTILSCVLCIPFPPPPPQCARLPRRRRVRLGVV